LIVIFAESRKKPDSLNFLEPVLPFESGIHVEISTEFLERLQLTDVKPEKLKIQMIICSKIKQRVQIAFFCYPLVSRALK
jgi:hypothetical protein